MKDYQDDDGGFDNYFNPVSLNISDDGNTFDGIPEKLQQKKLPQNHLDNELTKAHLKNLSSPNPMDQLKMKNPSPDIFHDLRSQIGLSESRHSMSNVSLRRRPQPIIACFQTRSLLPCCPWTSRCFVYSFGILLLLISIIILLGAFILSNYLDPLLNMGDQMIPDFNKKLPIEIKTINRIKKEIGNIVAKLAGDIKILLFILIFTLIGIFVSLSCRLQIFLFVYALCQFFVSIILFIQIGKINYVKYEFFIKKVLTIAMSLFKLSDCNVCKLQSTSMNTESDVIGRAMLKNKCCGVRSYKDIVKGDTPPQICCKNVQATCKNLPNKINIGCYDYLLNLTLNGFPKFKSYLSMGRSSLLISGYIFGILYLAISVIVFINGVMLIIDNINRQKNFGAKNSSRNSINSRRSA